MRPSHRDLTQRSERRADFGREKLRLFPRSVGRDVLEDRVSCKPTLGESFKSACDLFVAVRVVVERPSC